MFFKVQTCVKSMLGILELTLFNDTTYLQNIESDADGTKQWFRAALNSCLVRGIQASLCSFGDGR